MAMVTAVSVNSNGVKNRRLAPKKPVQKAPKNVAGPARTLERRARPIQESQFFGAGRAAQHGVAVGVAAKAFNDGFVAQFSVQIVLQAGLGE